MSSGNEQHGEAEGVLSMTPLPMQGTVVKGFGRGSKELGIPTGKQCARGAGRRHLLLLLQSAFLLVVVYNLCFSAPVILPANFPEDVVDGLPESITQGIYFGWAQVCVFVCVCVCVCLCVCMCVCMCVCACVSVYMCVCMLLLVFY